MFFLGWEQAIPLLRILDFISALNYNLFYIVFPINNYASKKSSIIIAPIKTVFTEHA